MTSLTQQQALADDTEGVTRAHWIGAARLWTVIAVFVVIGVARSIQVGVPFRDPHGAFLVTRVLLTLGISIGLVVVDAVFRNRRQLSVQAVRETIGSRWTPVRIALATVTLLAYHVTYFTYHNLKSWDVFNAPRDAMLSDWDKWLFFGHTPAVLLHDLLGTQVAAWVLMVWYETFPTLVILSFPAAVVLVKQMRDALAAIASFVWVWILGTGTYYLIPSLGPFDVEPGAFTRLPHMMIQDTQARYMAGRANLLAHPEAHDAFAQVSAFASLHVGVTVVIVGLAWWHRMRRTTIVLGVFLAGTTVATVYLGWHFFVDVPAGLLIGVLAWWLGPLTVGVRRT